MRPLCPVCLTQRLGVRSFGPFSLRSPYVRHASAPNSQFHGLLPPKPSSPPRRGLIPFPPSTGLARTGDLPVPTPSAVLIKKKKISLAFRAGQSPPLHFGSDLDISTVHLGGDVNELKGRED